MRNGRHALLGGFILALLSIVAGCSGSSSNTAASTASSSRTESSSASRTESSSSLEETTTTESPETTPPTTTEPDTAEALASCEEAAAHAVVTYQPNKQMVVGQTSQVVVRAAFEGQSTETTDTFPGSEQTTAVQTRLACNVEARLRGEDFDVAPDGFQRKSFLGSDHVDWSWDVNPHKVGDGVLTLEIQGVLRSPSGDQPLAGRDFRADITVTSQPEGFWTRANDVVVGFVTHPAVQFIGYAGLLGMAAFVWRRVRR